MVARRPRRAVVAERARASVVVSVNADTAYLHYFSRYQRAHRRASARWPAPTSPLVWRHSPKLDHSARPANGQKRLSPVGIALNRLLYKRWSARLPAAHGDAGSSRRCSGLGKRRRAHGTAAATASRSGSRSPAYWGVGAHTPGRFDDGIKV